MKYLIFSDNDKTIEQIVKQVGEDSVAAIYNLESFANYPSYILPDVLPIDGLEKFSKEKRGGVQALIAIDANRQKGTLQLGQSFFRRLEIAIAGTLKQHDIEFMCLSSPYTRIYGKFPNINISQGNLNRLTLGLIAEVFQTYPNEFAGKELDVWFCAWDEPEKNLDFADALKLPYVFSYCTTHSMQDRVIAFPDFNTCYNEEKFHDKINSTSKCREAAAKKWQENKIFWRGSLFVSFSRRCLFELGKKYSEYLQIEDSTKGKFLSMVDQARYKYLIDTRGNGWSGRLQTLLKLGRVIFVASRPYREWYFDRLIPMRHYVPIEEDMSDLIEKYFFMENHPEIYAKIVRNMGEFVEENLNPRRIVFDAKELLLRYGVVK